MTYLNPQDQQKLVWPPSFALARAYLDQLERSKGLAGGRIASARTALTNAERRAGAERKTALSQLAAQIGGAAGSSSDAAKVKALSAAITDSPTGASLRFDAPSPARSACCGAGAGPARTASRRGSASGGRRLPRRLRAGRAARAPGSTNSRTTASPVWRSRAPEPGSNVPGIAAILARTTAATGSSFAHRVLIGGRDDLKTPLTRNGADGFRLCGVVLDEEPSNPRARRSHGPHERGVVAVQTSRFSCDTRAALRGSTLSAVTDSGLSLQRPSTTTAWRIGVIGWSSPSVLQRADRRAKSSSGPNAGPSGLARNLNDSGKQGFRVDLAWKEGNDYVAMLSRPSGVASTPHTYDVDGDAPNGVHALTRLALGDFPYLSRRLFVIDNDVRASNELVEETLPSNQSERRRRGQRSRRARYNWRSPVTQSRLPGCLRARGPGPER